MALNYRNKSKQTTVGHLLAVCEDFAMFTKLVPDNAFAFTCGRGWVFHPDADVGMPLLEEADEEEEEAEDDEDTTEEEDEEGWK